MDMCMYGWDLHAECTACSTSDTNVLKPVSSSSNYITILLIGSSDGQVYVWDLHAAPTACSTPETNAILEPITKWKAHNDCVNGLR